MNKQELIEKYLQGQLNPEEEKTLQELSVSDSEFKEDLEFQRALKEALILEKEENLKAQLRVFEQEFSRSRFIIPNLVKWAVAAVFLLGITFTIFILNKPTPTSDKLFLAYFTPAENIHYPITRGSNDTLLFKAFNYYEQGQFDQALDLFQILELSGNYQDLKLYIGSSYLALGRVSEALDVLEPSSQQNGPMEIRFKWYHSLALIRAGRGTEARSILEEIAEAKGYQSENARLLLENLPKH